MKNLALFLLTISSVSFGMSFERWLDFESNTVRVQQQQEVIGSNVHIDISNDLYLYMREHRIARSRTEAVEIFYGTLASAVRKLVVENTLMASQLRSGFEKNIFGKGKSIKYELALQSGDDKFYGVSTFPKASKFPTVVLSSSALKYMMKETIVHESLHLTGESHNLSQGEPDEEGGFSTYGQEVVYPCANYAVNGDPYSKQACSREFLGFNKFEKLFVTSMYGAELRIRDMNPTKPYFDKMASAKAKIDYYLLLNRLGITTPVAPDNSLVGYDEKVKELHAILKQNTSMTNMPGYEFEMDLARELIQAGSF